MVQSIELLFDEATERALRGTWDAIAAAGLPSLAQHEGPTNRPHVTVAVAPTGLEAAADAVGEVAAAWSLGDLGLATEVGAPLLFGGHRRRWVLARQIVPTGPLLTLHSAMHRAIVEASTAAVVVDRTLPDAWTPHVTLARRMPAERLDQALGAIDPEPLPCRFVGIRLWDSVLQRVTPL